MVKAAIAALKEKRGSSLQSIQEYIKATYKFDANKQVNFIKMYLWSAIDKKAIIQSYGSRTSRRFKLAIDVENEEKSQESTGVQKPPTAKKQTQEGAHKKAATRNQIKIEAARKLRQ